MEGVFNLLHRSGYIQNRTIRMCSRNRQSIRFGELQQLLVIAVSGSKSLSKLVRAQVLVVVGRGRIVQLLKQYFERVLITKR
jgi:hypothetical protein